jgi:hypothetical protein
MTLPSEVIMQPNPRLVTFSPVLPRIRYWKAGAPVVGLGAGWLIGVAAWGDWPEVRDAEATAGKTSPAARKLRREDSRFTIPTSLFKRIISEYRGRKSIISADSAICKVGE